MSGQRMSHASFAAWVDVVGNVGLAGVKGSFGLLSGSKALLADSLYSAADAARSAAVLLGLRSGKTTQVDDGANMSGRADSITAFIVPVLLLLVGFEIGISALKTIYRGVDAPPKSFALFAIVFSILAKELLFRYKHRLGKMWSNQAVLQSASKHRSDVLSSVVALVGVLGAVSGDVLEVPAFYYLDPAAGLIISLLVIRTGYRQLMEAVHSRLERVLLQEDAEELVLAVQRVKGVIAVDDLIAREHGHYVIVDVKISVNPRITVMEGHEIARAVKHHLMKRFIHVADVTIHVNPYDPGYPYKHNMDSSAEDAPTLLH